MGRAIPVLPCTASRPVYRLHSVKTNISYMSNCLILIWDSFPDRDKDLSALMYSGASISITIHKGRYVSTTDYLITIKVSHRQHVSTSQVVIIRSIT